MRTDLPNHPDGCPPVARDGWVYILLGVVATGASLALSFLLAALLGAGTLFVIWFFRDPRRISPTVEGAVLSPADGTVLFVEPTAGDADVGPGTVISIFMSVFNVHINRVPVGGTVTAVRRHGGSFLAAYRRDASEANERVELLIQGQRGMVKVVQIAGLIARRIVCRPSVGQALLAGQRYGLIKFGSRVDLCLPQGYRAAVSAGDKVRGALTVVARFGEGPR